MKLDKKQLKEILKPIVKDIISEMFIEMRLDQVITESLKKVNFGSILSENENKQPTGRQIQEIGQKVKPNPDVSEYRKRMMDNIFIEEREEAENVIQKKNIIPIIKEDKQKDVLRAVLEDTAQSGFEIDSEEGTNPELVSADQVQQLVGNRDFSKFL